MQSPLGQEDIVAFLLIAFKNRLLVQRLAIKQSSRKYMGGWTHMTLVEASNDTRPLFCLFRHHGGCGRWTVEVSELFVVKSPSVV